MKMAMSLRLLCVIGLISTFWVGIWSAVSPEKTPVQFVVVSDCSLIGDLKNVDFVKAGSASLCDKDSTKFPESSLLCIAVRNLTSSLCKLSSNELAIRANIPDEDFTATCQKMVSLLQTAPKEVLVNVTITTQLSSKDTCEKLCEKSGLLCSFVYEGISRLVTKPKGTDTKPATAKPAIKEDPQNPAGKEDPKNPAGKEDPQNPDGKDDPQNPDEKEDPKNPSGKEDPKNPTGKDPQNPTEKVEPQEHTEKEDPKNPTGKEDPQNPTGKEDPKNPAEKVEPQEHTEKEDPKNPVAKEDPKNPTGKEDPQNPSGKEEPKNPVGKEDPQNPTGKVEPPKPPGKDETPKPAEKIEAPKPEGEEEPPKLEDEENEYVPKSEVANKDSKAPKVDDEELGELSPGDKLAGDVDYEDANDQKGSDGLQEISVASEDKKEGAIPEEDDEKEHDEVAPVPPEEDFGDIAVGGGKTHYTVGVDPDDGNSHFFVYFITVVGMSAILYIVFHNKKKILALILEGRNNRGRRPNSAQYRKLDNNLDEVITGSTKKLEPNE